MKKAIHFFILTFNYTKFLIKIFYILKPIVYLLIKIREESFF